MAGVAVEGTAAAVSVAPNSATTIPERAAAATAAISEKAATTPVGGPETVLVCKMDLQPRW